MHEINAVKMTTLCNASNRGSRLHPAHPLYPQLDGNLVPLSDANVTLASNLALNQGPDELDRQLPALGNGGIAGVGRHVQEDGPLLLTALVQVCKAGEVDEIAQVSACVLGYPKV